jgi:hypothetical protein
MNTHQQETYREENKRISLEQNYEIRYWTSTFHCTKEELCKAVGKVGASVEAVRRELMR